MIQTSPREATRLASQEVHQRVQERRDLISRLQAAGIVRDLGDHISTERLRQLAANLPN